MDEWARIVDATQAYVNGLESDWERLQFVGRVILELEQRTNGTYNAMLERAKHDYAARLQEYIAKHQK